MGRSLKAARLAEKAAGLKSMSRRGPGAEDGPAPLYLSVRSVNRIDRAGAGVDRARAAEVVDLGLLQVDAPAGRWTPQLERSRGAS